MAPDIEKLKGWAAEEIGEILEDLPPDIKENTWELPITNEARPSAELLKDGIDPDTLGLFTGPAFGEEQETFSPVPSQIILFLENLWDFANADEALFRKEVRRTYLHELGHYLGLDEEDLGMRDLD